ncbi:MAG: hypothetical protein P0S96_06205 [Simkaniaceae bacterium]|nr:hypothetical protein [Candidatus Sacchlamyda saccharinae]
MVYEFKCDLSKEALEADRVAFPGQEPHSISYFSGFKEIFENYVSHNNWDLDEITRQNIAPFQVCGFGIERKLDGQITAGDTIYLPSVEILEKRFGLKVKMMDGIASNSEFIENFLSGNLTISLKEYTHDLLVHGKNIFVSDVYGRLSEETWGAVNKMYPTIKSQKESSDPDTKEAAKLAELLLAFWVDLFTAGALSDEKPEHEEYPLTCEALVETIMRFTKSPEADAWWKRVSNPPAGEIYQRRRCLAAMKKLGLLSE